MSALTLEILGAFCARDETGTEVAISARKSRALLAVLALSPGATVTRERLAGLLWSDRGEEQARSSLRQALAVLRKELAGIDTRVLRIDNDRIALVTDLVTTDAVELKRVSRSEAADDLRQAAKLCRGELLADAGIRDPAFEEWLFAERRELSELSIAVLGRLYRHESGRERISIAQRLVALDPLREASQQALIEAYAIAGETALALRQFDICRDLLKNEIGVAPAPETETLRHSILNGRIAPSPMQLSVGGAPAKPPGLISIAVLPLTSMSGDASQEYIANNMTEDIIAELSRYRHITVLACNTTLMLKGKAANIPEIGRQLGADFIVEGSVRTSGSRVRVTIQLIDAETGAHAFADQIERTLDDAWGTFDDLVDVVVSRLDFNLYELASNVLQRQGVGDSPYALMLKAQHLWQIGADDKSQEILETIFQSDQRYAQAIAFLSYIYAYRYYFASTKLSSKFYNSAYKLADEAIFIEKKDPAVLYNVGRSLCLLGDHKRALKYSEMALNRHPRNMEIQATRGWILVCAGHHSEGRPLQERFLRLGSRLPVDKTTAFGDTCFVMGNTEEAYKYYSSVITDDWWPSIYLALHLGQLDRMKDARQYMQNIPEDFDMIDFVRKTVALYVREEDKERWLEGFRKLGVPV